MLRVAAMPGMWERTITIGSAGKSFSVILWGDGYRVTIHNGETSC